jgi:hypothetical protein
MKALLSRVFQTGFFSKKDFPRFHYGPTPEFCLQTDRFVQIGQADMAVGRQIPQIVKVPRFVPRRIKKGDDLFSCYFIEGIDAYCRIFG